MSGILLRRGGTLLLSNGLGQGLAFLTSIAIGHVLDVVAFGQYAVVMALVFVLGILAEAGLETSLAREIARAPAQSRALLGASLWAKAGLGGGLAVLLGLPPVAALLAPTPAAVLAVQLAGPLILLNAWNASFSAIFRAWGRMHYILAINVAGLGIQLVGTLALLRLAPQVAVLLAWLILVQVGELAAGLALFRVGSRQYAVGRDVPEGQSGIRHQVSGFGPAYGLRPTAYALLRRSWPFAVAGAIGALMLRVDLFLIEGLRGPTAVGIYAVASRLQGLLSLAPSSFFAALLPALAAAHSAGGAAGAGPTYRGARRQMAGAGLAATAVGLLGADALVWASFGPAYSAAAPSLRLLALGIVPFLVNSTTTIHLYATGREGWANRVLGLNLAVRVGLGLLLVNAWGAPGAALADLLGESAALLAYWRSGAMQVPTAATALPEAAR